MLTLAIIHTLAWLMLYIIERCGKPLADLYDAADRLEAEQLS